MKKQPEASSLTVAQLAKRLGCPYEGDGTVAIHGIADLETAKKGDLVFLSQPKLRHLLEKSQASAAIISLQDKFDKLPVLRSENPHLIFIQAVSIFFHPYLPAPGVHPQAVVAPSVKLGKHVSIGPFAVIGENTEIGDNSILFPLVSVYPGVKIGKHCWLHSHVSLREDIRIGNHVILHNGVVIGSDGFGYLESEDKTRIKIPQSGTVILEDYVEIGANTTIDRATLGETIVRKGTKIDNLAQVAHNVKIGENSIIISQSGIAGSSQLGKNIIMGGQVGVTDHVDIGDDVIIAAQSGVTKNVPSGAKIGGTPHQDIKAWRRAYGSLPRLHELIREVRKLKKRIEELEDN